MHRFLLLFSIVLLAACNNKSEKTGHTGKKEEPAAAISRPAGNVYDFTGSINNKIPVSLWYAVEDSVLSGELIYTRTKEQRPIRIIGSILPYGVYINEYLPDGQVSGIWDCKLSGNDLTGTWTALNSGKKLPVLLHAAAGKAHTADMFTAGDITGDYNYNYGAGGMGSLKVKKLDDRHILYNIQSVTAAPANNLAEVTDDTLELKGNEAIYKDKSESGLCNYRIRFFGDFAIIDSPEDGYECGFGHNATVTGTFIKTGNRFSSYAEPQ